MNKIKTWKRGAFIDSSKYSHMSKEWKTNQEKIEQCLIRPNPTSNPICRAVDPENAEWIAARLNIAAVYEDEISNCKARKQKIKCGSL